MQNITKCISFFQIGFSHHLEVWQPCNNRKTHWVVCIAVAKYVCAHAGGTEYAAHGNPILPFFTEQ